MTHTLVTQLRFARKEFLRCLEDVRAEDAVVRMEPMNCLSWIVGHLASQEHYLWIRHAQGRSISPDLEKLVGFGQPASTPSWEEMWREWRKITSEADLFLDSVDDENMHGPLVGQDKEWAEDVGLSLLRNIFHYWFHLGEAHAIRQMLGHAPLPSFVGNMASVKHSR
jgi:hypothetical protein